MGRPKDGAAPAPSPLGLWVGRARAVGALVGFAVVFWACRNGGFGAVDATLRGLLGAAALSLVSWWSALLVVQALVRSAVAQAHREARAAAERVAAARAADAPVGPGGEL
ncbi:hypothetical protein [Miltoncostaea marina]|uniref:hypothetical protein n=1 Tax=Miltoncostaea marina TaxID=2843215 RepID=UPI001C3CC8E1|nr:hypothetical protein [Miltoncostaea marina]